MGNGLVALDCPPVVHDGDGLDEGGAGEVGEAEVAEERVGEGHLGGLPLLEGGEHHEVHDDGEDGERHVEDDHQRAALHGRQVAGRRRVAKMHKDAQFEIIIDLKRG